MNKVILKIEGMRCSACSNGLEKYLNKKEHIVKASVNLVLAQALIEYDDKITLSDIENYIKEAGFTSLGIYEQSKEKQDNKNKILIYLGILLVFMMYITMSNMFFLPIINYLNMNKNPIIYTILLSVLTIPFLIYGFDIFKNGYKSIKHKNPNMDTLVSIGVLTSLLYSIYSMIMIFNNDYNYLNELYFMSVAMIIYFVKLGRNITENSKEKTKKAISELVQITPVYALLKDDNKEKKVTIDEVKKNDILIAKPGMKIAVDGVIVKGSTHLDESFITGESMFVRKNINDEVIAGSINYDGYIEYKAIRIGKESTISEIVKLVTEAVNTKAPIAKLADKVSGYFVPFIMIISSLTLLGYLLLGYSISDSLNYFVSVLLVACPCALGLATPLAIVVSSGVCAKKGILVKSSEILENVSKVNTFVFDKTGTLTFGNLKVHKIFNYSNYEDKELLKIVGSIESNSSHPIAEAFREYNTNKEVTNYQEISGMGIQASIGENNYFLGNNTLLKKLQIKNEYLKDEDKLANDNSSIIYVCENNIIIALIGVKDIVRPNAKKVISKLKKMDKEVIMLTGDNEVTAKNIGDYLEINRVIANVLPKDKGMVIKQLIKEGKKVMMVGDGINDAVSLVNSTIGVSFKNSNDIANSSSDVIILTNDLEKIISLIKISSQTLKNIKQNLFWAFFYNICMISIAIGLLKPFNIEINPTIASVFMTISSLSVVFNALRLGKKLLKL